MIFFKHLLMTIWCPYHDIFLTTTWQKYFTTKFYQQSNSSSKTQYRTMPNGSPKKSANSPRKNTPKSPKSPSKPIRYNSIAKPIRPGASPKRSASAKSKASPKAKSPTKSPRRVGQNWLFDIGTLNSFSFRQNYANVKISQKCSEIIFFNQQVQTPATGSTAARASSSTS